ncbi:MAG: ECF transporter S component [Candidatus Bathyarchaeia archaeon]|nr:ECF transporter S component [Candidatus Bathyarchaeota archaeon]
MMRAGGLAASSIMAALVCVATIFIIVPIPATQGYFNVGDAMVMVAALTFGPLVGAAAGGIGSSLADIIMGYSFFAPYTLVIKGLEGLLAGWIYSRWKERGRLMILLAWLAGGTVMVTGYFVVEYSILGYGAGAFVELPFNMVQMAVAGIVGIPVSMALKKRIRIYRAT